MKRLVHTFLVLLALAPHVLRAQSQIFQQETKSQAFLVRHNGGGPSQDITDHFIQRLSQGSGKSLHLTEFVIAHDEFVRQTKVDATRYEVFVTFGNMRLTGDTRYRGIDMSELLLPGSARFTLERRTQGGLVLDTWEFQDVPLNGDPMIAATFKATDTTGNFTSHVVRLKDKTFLYKDNDRRAFDHRTKLVDEYYDSVQELEDLYRELNAIDPENIDEISVEETELRNISGQIDLIRERQYREQLGLKPGHDPAGFLARFAEVDAVARELDRRIGETKSRLPQRFYERALAQLEAGNTEAARADLSECIRFNGAFAPAHFELARLDYRRGDVGGASERLQMMFATLEMDPATASKATGLAGVIFQNLIGNADYAVDEGRYGDALLQLEMAGDLCEGAPVEGCGIAVERGRTDVHSGVFLERVENGRKALEAGRFDEAESDAFSAIAYAEQHAPHVPDPGPASELLALTYRRMYEGLLADANTLIEAGDLASAGKKAREALDFQAAHAEAVPDAEAATAMLHRVMGLQYKSHIAEGRAQVEAGDVRTALDRFDKAHGIAQEYPVAQDSALAGLRMQAAKAILREDLPKALELARTNRLAEARAMQTDLEAMRRDYGLSADKDLQPGFRDLKEAIFDQECINAQSEFEGKIEAAKRAANTKAYIEAVRLFDEALGLARASTACALDDSPARTGRARILPAAEYQEQVAEADVQIDRAMYKQAVETYLNAGELFRNGLLADKYRLSHKPLFDYITGSGRREFMKYGAEYFTAKKEYGQAISILRILLNFGYKKGRLKPVMVRIGTELAIRDYPEDPRGEPKSKALGYTQGEKGLKKLYKAYVKQWKRM